MANSTVQVRQTRNLLQRPNLPSVSLLSFVLVLLFAFSFSSALPLSESTSPNIRKSLGNNELIIYPAEWIKRSGGGSVNFSPGWGKRSDSFIQAYPGGFMYKRGSVNFSPGWGKRSGGSVNFSPGWGKRSGGSVNFSPGWGKRSGGTVNFSPSWGKRSGGTVNFSPSWGKRSGGSVNFSPGWGKRSGGTVNFSPSWGKRSLVNYRGLNNYFEDGIPKQQGNIFVPFWKGGYGLSRLGNSPDNHLSRLQQLSQISRLEKRNYTPVEIMNGR